MTTIIKANVQNAGITNLVPYVAIKHDLLEELLLAVERVVNKYGCDKNGEPSDWAEWKDVRKTLVNVRKGHL